MRAVVIGGSMAGMCAARALARHVDHVTIFDRDTWSDAAPAHRIGVPQSHHAHALLARGQRDLERLFPGFEKEMRDAGAVSMDITEGMAILRKWGWGPRAPSGLTTLWASRPLVECVVRRALRKVDNIELQPRSSVQSLRITRGNGHRRVIGITVKDASGANVEVDADIVVDASGRGTKAAKWFETEGITVPEDETVEAFAGYASRFYERPPAAERPADWWWDGLWIEGVPPDFRRGGVAFPIENHRWLVTAVGFGKDYPPTDEREWIDYLGSLASPILEQVTKRCKPVSDIVSNRSTTNRFRHYEKWSQRLDGFLAIGDSVCAFNPVYGQGMSTSAACATILEEALGAVGPSPERLSSRFFHEQGRFLSGVWALAAGADFIWPTTVGKRPFVAKVLQPYQSLMAESAHSDPAVLRALIPIFHLIEHPTKVASPKTMSLILRSAVTRRIATRTLTMKAHPRGSLPPS